MLLLVEEHWLLNHKAKMYRAYTFKSPDRLIYQKMVIANNSNLFHNAQYLFNVQTFRISSMAKKERKESESLTAHQTDSARTST